MNKANRMLGWLIVVAGLAVLILSAFGQGAEAAPMAVADEKVRGFFDAFTAWKFLLVPIVTILIQAVRKWIPKIPPNYFPWIAPIIGGLLDYGASKAGIWTGSGEIGLMCGGLATWFHQTGRQTAELISPPEPTP